MSGKKVVEKLKARQDPRQQPVAVQGPLGLAGRAGGVDNQRRVVRSCFHGLELFVRQGEALPKIEEPSSGGPAHGQNKLQLRQPVTDFHEVGQVVRIGDDTGGTTVLEPVFQSHGPEQRQQGYGNAPQLVGGYVADEGLRALGQEDADPVPPGDPVRLQGVGQTVGPLLQLMKGDDPFHVILAHMNQGHAARVSGPPVAHIHTDVVRFRQLPLETTINGVIGFSGETAFSNYR